MQRTDTPINKLSQIATLKTEVRKDIDKSEEKLCEMWNEMFHKRTEEVIASPTKKVISLISASAGVIDVALLGWKLHNKFKKGNKFFKKKK